MTSEGSATSQGAPLERLLAAVDPALVGQLRTVAARLAREAGERLVAGRPDEVSVASTKSSATDVVTAADRASERWLREELQRLRPADAVLGEEYGEADAPAEGTVSSPAAPAVGDDAGPRLTWVLDPIDGTVNYLYGLPAWGVSVACVVGDPQVPGAWAPVAGAVSAPVWGELFHAGAGQGAVVEGPRGGPRELTVSHEPDASQGLVATGFGYAAERRAAQGEVAAALLPRVRDLRRMGSAAIDLCCVAAGRVDAYYESGTQVWDHAAGVLVVTEAGGRVTGLGGAPLGAPMVVAGGPAMTHWLHDELVRLGA
ncbi:inositol monophosphatase family protein [Kytococcus sedentarius]|uniref:inositol monophosphatase family protein n=1 Tax=Kytococcus sedentarius TaxID=1276 RepID=UPI0035BC3594